MTDTELEILRLKLRLEAVQTLIRMFYTGLANSSPNGAQLCRAQFARLRQEHAKIALKGTPPEYSDLVASEYQEALEDILTFIESGFRN